MNERLASIYCHYIADCTECKGCDEDGAPNGDGCDAMFDWVKAQEAKQQNRYQKLQSWLPQSCITITNTKE